MKKVSIFKVIGCFALALCTSLCAVLAVGCSGNKDEKTTDGGLVVTPGDQNEMISLLAGPTSSGSPYDRVDEYIKNSVGYKLAYNEAIKKLKTVSEDSPLVSGSFTYLNTYKGISTASGGTDWVDFTFDVSSLTPYDIVTSVAFTDSAIIF